MLGIIDFFFYNSLVNKNNIYSVKLFEKTSILRADLLILSNKTKENSILLINGGRTQLTRN